MPYKEYFSRNIGFLTEKEQKKIKLLSIGIAGAGGDGGLLAERLARFGVGRLILAEPDKFDKSNINRQYACNIKSVGKNKAEVIAKELKLINPELEVVIYKDGINESNVKEFVSLSDVIIDEVEYSLPQISVMLAREARRQKKYVFMGANIGWGASLFCFSPTGMTFEKYFCYDADNQTINPLKYIKKIPGYFDNRLLESVLSGRRPMPGLSSSVGLVASFVSSQAILFAIGRARPTIAPKFVFVDALELKLEKR